MMDIRCESLLYPLRVVYNSKLGMRGQMGAIGPTGIPVKPSGKKKTCPYCHESINMNLYATHLSRCIYEQVNCDLCGTLISERLFLLCHKINGCPRVTECKKCLGYFSTSNTHTCQDIDLLDLYSEKDLSSIMPLLSIREDGTVLMQIGTLILKGLTTIKPSEFTADDKDETFTTNFEMLPGYELQLFNHKRAIACGDSAGLRWILKYDALPSSYGSELFHNVESLMDASQKGTRLVLNSRVSGLSSYENIEINKRPK